MSDVCRKCYHFKRRAAHFGVCWKFLVAVGPDETWPCYEPKVIWINKTKEPPPDLSTCNKPAKA